MRLFIGIALPDDVRQALRGLVTKLRTSGADVKWVTAAHMHITLKFLGEVEETAISGLALTLRGAASRHAPLDLAFHGTGAFPNERKPRVVWAGIRGDMQRLRTLHRDIESALSGLGFEPEDRPYSPHITIGRVRTPKGHDGLARELEYARDQDFGAMVANGFNLYRSELSPDGPRYTVIGAFDLSV